ncbi:MAG TPA: hypothetical protein VJ972_11295, partial [Anaerolineales bacterium]|nr:hypothetical protein [Anaerolineales bacterium]
SLPFEGYVIFKDYVTHLEYIRSCDELWQKGMYFELNAYQHHVFMDWRFVDDERWITIDTALNGAGVESISAKWDEMFGEKEDVIEVTKVKKLKKKAVGKKASVVKKKISKSVANKPDTKTKTSAKKSVKKSQKGK